MRTSLEENLLELGTQAVPLRDDAEHGFPAFSRPLFELAELAPKLPPRLDHRTAGYPISNDESAGYYGQTQVRTNTEEYRSASSRTAFIVGEGALMAALPYISEDTIVLVDNDEGMCAFMSRYVDELRTAKSRNQWGENMGFARALPGSFENDVNVRTIVQINEWTATGYTHPLEDEDLFAGSSRLARQKAIIPWRADITSYGDMRHLGDVLRSHDANITFMNLSNSIACDDRFRHTRHYASILGALPVTQNAPILTTSRTVKADAEMGRDFIVEATGPFFGLENLANHGGKTRGFSQGSLLERQYAHREGAQIARQCIKAAVMGKMLQSVMGNMLAQIAGGTEKDAIIVDVTALDGYANTSPRSNRYLPPDALIRYLLGLRD